MKLRGLMWNQISTPDFAYQNDQRNKIYTLGDFEKKTPTHMVATHAISKSQQNFQNRIPRELDKNFYIPRISMIYWISSNFLKLKNRPQKKVISIPNPGIQPNYTRNKLDWKTHRPSTGKTTARCPSFRCCSKSKLEKWRYFKRRICCKCFPISCMWIESNWNWRDCSENV